MHDDVVTFYAKRIEKHCKSQIHSCINCQFRNHNVNITDICNIGYPLDWKLTADREDKDE